MEFHCDVCNRKAKYRIRRVTTGTWFNVCAVHDNYIAIQNLLALGYSKAEAHEIDRQVRLNKEEKL